MVIFSQPTGNENNQDKDWTTVQNKQNNNGQVSNKNETSNLIKTKVTFTLQVPKTNQQIFQRRRSILPR
jgi:hypothetical protein